MLQPVSKNNLYLYLFFFIFLTSIFNFQILAIYKDVFRITKININGLSYNERKLVKNELINLKDINIFSLDKEKISEKLYEFKFLEKIYVNKVMPSSININLTKTNILGRTLRNGKNFYIGQNGKFINTEQLLENTTTLVFGDFNIDEFLNLQEILKNKQLDIKKIEKYYYFKNKRWDLLFSNGLTLKLPAKNVEKSIEIYKQLFENDNLINTNIIDLRVVNQIILTNNNE
tara:strand:- start:534 stop:1226 length:693 start_codon:yes stop_codon:yes gene_type:complete